MALTKADLAKGLFEQGLGLSRSEAMEIVELFFEAITQKLTEGEEVKLSGFGNFRTRHKKSRPGRNPRTGEEVMVSERWVVTFRAGQKLRQLIGETAS